MKKLVLCLGASALGTLVPLASAQTPPPALPPANTRSVDNLTDRSPPPPPAPAKKTNSMPEGEVGIAIPLLREVRVEGISLLNQEVTNYWTPKLGKSVTEQETLAFKQWVYNKLDERGYLGFAQVTETKAQDGSILVVKIVPLTIGRVTVVAKDIELGDKYSKEVARRFSARFVQGQVLDVSNLEAQLNAAAYDLPVVLDVELRTTESVADIAINMTAAAYSRGRLQGGVAQFNNYGLSQYGQHQALGVLRFDGLSPLSTATVGGMVSERVTYLRGEYDWALMGSGMRMQVFGSMTNSSAAVSATSNASNDSSDLGLRLTGLLTVTGSASTQWGLELARHDSKDTTANIETGNYVDHQLRLRFRTDGSVSNTDWFNNELVLTTGELDLSPNQGVLGTDQGPGGYRRNGEYQKLEMTGGVSKPFSNDASLSASVRWHGQMASKALVGFNQISIGGTNGIRAYNSADGTGDTAAVLSFDITKTISPMLRVGVLWDIGRVDQSREPNASSILGKNSVELQGAGFQASGEVAKFNWTASAAKSIGGGQDTIANSSLTPPGGWRFNLEVSRPF